MALAEAAERVIAYATEHGITPWAQVIVGSEVDAGLVDLGWRPTYVVTDVLVCRLITLLGDDLPDPRVSVARATGRRRGGARTGGAARTTSIPRSCG